jgi:uncharacterized repeat protein (TIGR01451 family)
MVSCNGGTLNGGETWTVTIRGVVTAPGGTTLNNVASFTGTKSAQNFTSTATAQTQVLAGGGGGGSKPDLTLNKTGPSTVVAGASFDYILTVNNLGGVNATGITVRDTLPTGVVVSSIDGTSLFTCTASGAPTVVVLCTGGAVNQVSKVPRLINEHEVTPTIGSHSYARVTGDFNFQTGEMDTLEIKGRHDACFALRTPVVVEAMTAIALADLALMK